MHMTTEKPYTVARDCRLGLLAAEPGWAREFLPKLERAESRADFAAVRSMDTGEAFETVGPVAVLRLDGLLLPRKPWWAWGLAVTGLDEFEVQLAAAVRDPKVHAIVIRVYSGGGATDGVGDVADRIAEARKTKPIVAFAENVGASGAYWLAASAAPVTVSPYAAVGSIGVFTVVDDVSEAAQRAGIKTRLIRSANLKGIGTPGVPISDDEVAELQRRVDQHHRLFVESVARGRGMSAREVEKLATGGVWIGQQAVHVGLADRVGTFDQVVAELNAQFAPAVAARSREEQQVRDRERGEQQRAEDRQRKCEAVAKALDARRVGPSAALIASLVDMGWSGCDRARLSTRYEFVGADDLEAVGSRLGMEDDQVERLRTKMFFEERGVTV
jgi:signal peptide peptidase SppA